METTVSAIQTTSASQPDLVNLLAADVNNRQLMAVSFFIILLNLRSCWAVARFDRILLLDIVVLEIAFLDSCLTDHLFLVISIYKLRYFAKCFFSY